MREAGRVIPAGCASTKEYVVRTDNLRLVARYAGKILQIAADHPEHVKDISNDLKAIIDTPRQPAPPAGLSRKRYKQLVAYWETRFPGKGELLMSEELLAPFYADDLSFEPRPPLADLQEQGRKAIFWREIKGVKLFKATDRDGLWDIEDSLGRSLRDSLRHSLRDSLGRSLRDSLRHSLRHSLGNSLGNSLFYACGYALIEGQDEDFSPLLRLWRSGNLPVGFDREGNLLVICA